MTVIVPIYVTYHVQNAYFKHRFFSKVSTRMFSPHEQVVCMKAQSLGGVDVNLSHCRHSEADSGLCTTSNLADRLQYFS